MNAWPEPAPSSMIRPPSSGSAEPEFNRINLSSTSKFVVFNVVVVPLTVKSPLTTTSLKVTSSPVPKSWLIASRLALLEWVWEAPSKVSTLLSKALVTTNTEPDKVDVALAAVDATLALAVWAEPDNVDTDVSPSRVSILPSKALVTTNTDPLNDETEASVA
jgi:hypothetical protein